MYHYYTKSSGDCTDNGDTYISSISECEHGYTYATGNSISAGSYDQENSGPISWDPPGCYYESSHLKVGGTNNNGPCSSSDLCVCRHDHHYYTKTNGYCTD